MAIVAWDAHDAKVEREMLKAKFILKCEKNYPAYRCEILWDSYMEAEKNGTP